MHIKSKNHLQAQRYFIFISMIEKRQKRFKKTSTIKGWQQFGIDIVFLVIMRYFIYFDLGIDSFILIYLRDIFFKLKNIFNIILIKLFRKIYLNSLILYSIIKTYLTLFEKT